MRTLTYWMAESLDDAQCFNIRARTKREVTAYLADNPSQGSSHAKPVKVWVRYQDAFDLVELSLSEGGGYWEYRPKGLRHG